MTNFLKIDEIKKGDLIAFHWNSHKHCYSILKMNSPKTVGKLIGYSEKILIENSYFIFQESKRNYTLESGKKERHSFVVGEFLGFDIDLNGFKKAYYNPLKVSTFVDAYEFFKSGSEKVLPNNCFIFGTSFYKEEENKLKPDIFYK